MSEITKFRQLVEDSSRIVIIQASNPDVDSLGSALALEAILKDQGKSVALYCGAPMPKYLQFLDGWQSVVSSLPDNYELAIMVDNSALKLLDHSSSSQEWQERLSQKRLIILDHHPDSSDPIQAELIINDRKMVATGQLIYQLAKAAEWSISPLAAEHLAASILSDSLGLTSQSLKNNPQPLRVMAELVELGVNLASLNDKRLKQLQIKPDIVDYKGKLLSRIEFSFGNQIAFLSVSHDEIKQLSGRYNPTTILDEMRLVEGVKLTIGLKQYYQRGILTRVTARLRCYDGCQIASELAAAFSGGGHPYAAGIKWEASELELEDIKTQLLNKAEELLGASL